MPTTGSGQQTRSGQHWKVGRLAAETGLTVRTLHHYDDIGLVRPSGRTASGHRLYKESDVERLYQVLALRQLGLSLDAIATVTDGDTSLSEILDAHRAYLDDQLAATRTLRAQVEMLSRTVRTSPDASVADFLQVIRGVIEVDDMFERYFDKGQIADLAERRAMLGDDVITAAETSWQELIPRVDAALSSGMDPACSEAQEMARQWMDLLEQFHGGDEGLRDSLYRMHEDNAQQIEQEFCGPSREQIEFITKANEARAV
ncbi:MerR family transcriptional regulator [Rhodococcus pyridinivorans KG-16]|uniref:MerR family transcriptional regulator n=1 Tax=Rhodococcus pyridinivorans KG-16 TaxID=1441730 RepID=A0A0V9UQW9_9NOCA|nr:MerR family transcriptional regulator [Rhodococcus pyridinivorans]KSZ60351.1 MerR family transcriptional regulator [Rhodococcus pyridinivorans KG-16]